MDFKQIEGFVRVAEWGSFTRAVRGGLSGRVAIGLPPSLAQVFTVPLTRAFRTHLPDVSLSISEALSTQCKSGW